MEFLSLRSRLLSTSTCFVVSVRMISWYASIVCANLIFGVERSPPCHRSRKRFSWFVEYGSAYGHYTCLESAVESAWALRSTEPRPATTTGVLLPTLKFASHPTESGVRWIHCGEDMFALVPTFVHLHGLGWDAPKSTRHCHCERY